jgi:hypothetical protein
MAMTSCWHATAQLDAMVAQYAEEAQQLTARLKRDMARLQEIAQTKPLKRGPPAV